MFQDHRSNANISMHHDRHIDRSYSPHLLLDKVRRRNGRKGRAGVRLRHGCSRCWCGQVGKWLVTMFESSCFVFVMRIETMQTFEEGWPRRFIEVMRVPIPCSACQTAANVPETVRSSSALVRIALPCPLISLSSALVVFSIVSSGRGVVLLS